MDQPADNATLVETAPGSANLPQSPRCWWKPGRPFEPVELVVDGVVHGIGIVAAIGAGAALIALTSFKAAPHEILAIILYVGTLVAVLSISLAYNLWPISRVKRHLARFDQAAIFLLIAGTYTPFLMLVIGRSAGPPVLAAIWCTALCGAVLKLTAPQLFGRLGVFLYLGLACGGLVVLPTLIPALPGASLWLLAAGGVIYTLGIVFHLWERLKFHTALWHSFVVVAATLHFGAVFAAMSDRL